MTVKELRQHLAAFDDDEVVVVPAYENGWLDAPQPSAVIVRKKRRREWYEGKYQRVGRDGHACSEPLTVIAIGEESPG